MLKNVKKSDEVFQVFYFLPNSGLTQLVDRYMHMTFEFHIRIGRIQNYYNVRTQPNLSKKRNICS